MTIRNDDVLQASLYTPHQRKDINGRNLFELFLESDKVFEKYDFPQTLAVIAEGITIFPEWTEHIKKHKHRYDIQLHGWNHVNYANFSKEFCVNTLIKAKAEIETTFGVNVDKWYPPFGRKGTPVDMKEICEKVGVEPYFQDGKVDAKLWLMYPGKYDHVNFHFWHSEQVGHVKQILYRIHGK